MAKRRRSPSRRRNLSVDTYVAAFEGAVRGLARESRARGEAARKFFRRVPAARRRDVYHELVAIRMLKNRERDHVLDLVKPRKRNRPVPTIAGALEAVTYHGGDGKKRTDGFIHEFETEVEAIPLLGGEVELADGSVLEVEPGSVLERSKVGVPLWMED